MYLSAFPHLYSAVLLLIETQSACKSLYSKSQQQLSPFESKRHLQPSMQLLTIPDTPRIVNQSPVHNQNIFGESSLSEFRSCSIMGEDHPKMFLNANLEIGSQRNLINLVLVSTCDVNIPSQACLLRRIKLFNFN